MNKSVLTNPLFHIALLILLTVIAYSNTFKAPFVFDDKYTIVDNKNIREVSNIPRFFLSLKGPLSVRPVTLATLTINFAIGGLNPVGYHVFNLLVHILNGILLYHLITTTAGLINYVKPYVNNMALFSSLLFLLHPVQTEAVTYVISRSMLLCTFFYLLGILVFVKSVHKENKTPYVIALFVISLLGMGAREDFVTFPLMLVLYDLVFISGFRIKDLLAKRDTHIPVFLTLFYLLFLVMNFDYKQTAGASVEYITPIENLMTQFKVHFTYLRLLILPYGQSIDYDYRISRTLFDIRTFSSFIGYLILWGTGIYLLIKKSPLAYPALWFMVTLTPASSVVPLVDSIFEHRLYLSSIGFFTIISFLLFYIRHEKSNSNLSAV